MWWAIALLAVVVAIQFVLPTRREIAIAKEPRVLPAQITPRDTAYVIEYYRRFGRRKFRLNQLADKSVSRELMDQFGFRSGPLDDGGILRTRLPDSGLLEKVSAGVFRLTEAAEQLAKEYEGN